MAVTTQDILGLLERNRGRGHEVAELAVDLSPCSEHDVEAGLKTLVKAGKVKEGSWGHGHIVYHASTPRKAEQEVAT